MRNWILHSLLAVYLITATEYHELLRIPFLIQHFIDHQENEGIDFPTFLSIHYAGSAQSHNHHHEDDHLPFKSCDPIVHMFTAIAEDQHAPEFAIPLSTLSQLPLSCIEDTRLPLGVASSVWRPPQA